MAAELILKNTSSTLEITFSAGDASGAVTVTITRADGTALVTGAATTNETEPGRYTYLMAPQTELDSLTAVWTGTWGGVAQSVATYAEVVGGHIFTLADLRAFGDQAITTAGYPDAVVRAARARITDKFQKVCGVSFIPRYQRDVLDGTGLCAIFATRKRVTRMIAASVDGSALSAPDVAALYTYPTGRIERLTYWPNSIRRNVILAYEHGWPSTPADISFAAMTLARYELVPNDISDRMVSFDNDLGSVRLSVPGRNYPTGIPIVDSILSEYDETDPVGP